jgi:CRP-like cAMP-binding protein
MTTEEQLKEAFDKYYSFPISFWRAVVKAGSLEYYQKEHCLKASGKTENHLYFILSGCGGVLLWNKNNFICTDIILKGDFICDYFSFLVRSPTPYEVVVFEDSELFKVSYDSLVRCLEEHSYSDKFWRYAIQALYVDKHLQLIQATTRTAQQIYCSILNHEPDLLQKVPQKYIASFLGITPQSLSRIRQKLQRQKLT